MAAETTTVAPVGDVRVNVDPDGAVTVTWPVPIISGYTVRDAAILAADSAVGVALTALVRAIQEGAR